MMRGQVKKSRTYETIQEQRQLACELRLHSSLLGSNRLGYEMKVKIIKSERHFLFLCVPCSSQHAARRGKSKVVKFRYAEPTGLALQSWSRTPASEMNDERL